MRVNRPTHAWKDTYACVYRKLRMRGKRAACNGDLLTHANDMGIGRQQQVYWTRRIGQAASQKAALPLLYYCTAIGSNGVWCE